MNIKMTGIDHCKADIALREKFSFTKTKSIRAMRAIKQKYHVEGCVLVSTCNRTELWVSGPGADDLYSMLCFAAGAGKEDFREYFTDREGTAAVRHLHELSCGMKSIVFAEDQILTQVKEALALAREAECADALLEKLFSSAVCAAKKVKTLVKFRGAEPSMAHSAAERIAQHFESPEGVSCLVVGNGKMGRLAASALRERGFDVCVTVRQYTRGEVVIPMGCEAVMYEDRLRRLKEADVLVSATSSPHYTFRAEDFIRDEKMRVVVDLAVPRDIDPQIASFPNTVVYDVDDLGGCEEPHAGETKQAQEILAEVIEKLEDWYYFRNLADEIEEISRLGAEETAARAAYALACEGRDDADLVLRAVELASKNVISSLIYGLKDADRETADNCVRAFKKAAEKKKGASGRRLRQGSGAGGQKDGKIRRRAFPLFIDLAGRTVKVFGGGRIAARRVKTLLEFGCGVEVVSPALHEDLRELAGQYAWREARYREGDAAGAALVLAATDDRAVNAAIARECGQAGIPVSVADRTEECTFYCPAVVCKGDVTVGITASGKDHVLASYTAQQIRKLFTGIGESN